MPGTATDGARDSSGIVVVGAGRAGPLASVVSVRDLGQGWTGGITRVTLSLIQFVDI